VRILSGKRPRRPAHPGFTDKLWDLIQRCWDQKPQLRPAISEVVCYLGTVIAVQDEPRHPMTSPLLLAFRRSYQALFHKRPGIELNGFGESLHSTKSGEWEKPLGIQNTPSSPHGPLRSAVIWLSNCGARFIRSRYGLLDNLLVECGATETGMTSLGLIATTLGTTPKPQETPPTSNQTERRPSVSLRPTALQCTCTFAT
jgi:hypothetical protein